MQRDLHLNFDNQIRVRDGPRVVYVPDAIDKIDAIADEINAATLKYEEGRAQRLLRKLLSVVKSLLTVFISTNF